MKRAASVLAVAGVFLITVFGIGRLWLAVSLPPLAGRDVALPLGDTVVVRWDSLAVPHVVARSDSDFFTAIGYLHARDRGWQLELLRHAALGRLSELFGARTVAADRALRELEIARIAAARLARLGAESRRVLEAYARGVNAWLATGPRALELRLLGHTPEPWLPTHSLAIGVLQAWDLRTTGDEIELAAVAARLGVSRALELLPEPSAGDPVIVGPATPAFPAAHHLALPAAHPAASNAWVIAGHRTRSGKPILANDPHLTLRAPSIWYLVGAHAPTYHIVGATIPGLPVIVLGHTRAVAWGFTNAMVDDVDYVVEQLSHDSTHYRTATTWMPVEVVAETIVVRGTEPVIVRRRRTARGPLLARPRLDSARAYALRWVAQDGSEDEIAALLGMARAREWRALRAAARLFGSPQQNVVYADSGGHIGYLLAGRVPLRRAGAEGSPFPHDGRRYDGDIWSGWVDPGLLPHDLNPERGWIATANNRVVGPEFPHFLTRHYDHPYRARRISELLRSDSAATTASASRHQMDLVDPFARRWRLLAARAALAGRRPDVADRLRGWDGAMTPDAAEPTVFWSWYQELIRLAYEDELPAYQPAQPLHRWLAGGDGAVWWDDVRTPVIETLDTMAQRAMTRVLERGRTARWGDVHHTSMDHPLAGVPVLGRLLGFAVGPIETGGSNHTLNNSSMLDDEPPFASSYGPSLRHVVDFAHLDDAGGFILPAGQSGHPSSRHYRDQTTRWLRGELWVLPLDPTRVRARATLLLLPGEAAE